MLIPLTKLKPGESGKVAEVDGGDIMLKRCQRMGLRPGKLITKVSSHFWRGPQTVKIDNSQVSIGYGMAIKIMIEVDDVQ